MSPRRDGPPVLLLGVFTLLLLSRALPYHLTALPRHGPDSRLLVADWVGQNTDSSDCLLVGDIGYVGYYNPKVRLYDYWGLVWKAPTRLLAEPLFPGPLGPGGREMARGLQPTVILLESTRAPERPLPGYHYLSIPRDTGSAPWCAPAGSRCRCAEDLANSSHGRLRRPSLSTRRTTRAQQNQSKHTTKGRIKAWIPNVATRPCRSLPRT